MTIFSWLRGLLALHTTPIRHRVEDCAAWFSDPLSHPAIERMSQREVADLPLRGSVHPARC